MNYLKYFEDWQGTIKVDQAQIDKYWNYSANVPQRYLDYIQKEISPIKCELNGNTIKIGGPGTKLCDAEMSVGFNMVRTVEISEISIWLSFGPGGGYNSEDGYFNTTIHTNTKSKIYGLTNDYKFTSETIKDLCEFLNKIFKEGVIEYNRLD